MQVPFCLTSNIVFLDDVPVILIKAMGLNVPMWIGHGEAAAIHFGITGKQAKRPMTHDLIKTMIETMGAAVTKMAITELRENTYIAEVHVGKDGETMVFDARPSDAIALAIRFDAPLFIEENVIVASADREANKDILALIERDAPAALEIKETDTTR